MFQTKVTIFVAQVKEHQRSAEQTYLDQRITYTCSEHFTRLSFIPQSGEVVGHLHDEIKLASTSLTPQSDTYCMNVWLLAVTSAQPGVLCLIHRSPLLTWLTQYLAFMHVCHCLHPTTPPPNISFNQPKVVYHDTGDGILLAITA